MHASGFVFISSVNDTVRDSVTTTTSPALDPSTLAPQFIQKNFALSALRSWKMIAFSRDILDSVIHRDSAFLPVLYAGDTALISVNLAPRFAAYQARFFSLPDSVASATPGQPKQVLRINRLVLRIDGLTVRDSTAVPGPYFASGESHTLDFDYVGAGTGTWVPAGSGTLKNLNAIHFPTRDTGYIAGDTVAMKTVDGGRTWSTMPAGGAPRAMRHLSFANGSHGVLGGDSATITTTTDGGATWSVLKVSTFTNRASPVVLFGDTGLSFTTSPTPGGSTGTRRTTNGGTGWGTVSSFGGNIYGMHCASRTACWAVGYAGVIRKNVDPGSSATFGDPPQVSGTSKALRGVYALDPNTVWAVGDTGLILKTTNGGTTWAPQTSGTLQNLTAVHFLDTAIGYAVGENGTILATANGGTTWAAQTSGTSRHLRGIWLSGARAFVVGDGGTILKLADVRQMEMLAYGPMGSWDISKPLYTGTRYVNVAAGENATLSLLLRWTGPTTGVGTMSAGIGRVGTVIVNGNFDGTLPKRPGAR